MTAAERYYDENAEDVVDLQSKEAGPRRIGLPSGKAASLILCQ
jgi:hypothetical protein